MCLGEGREQSHGVDRVGSLASLVTLASAGAAFAVARTRGLSAVARRAVGGGGVPGGVGALARSLSERGGRPPRAGGRSPRGFLKKAAVLR